ncbi:hypothetical protein [Cellulomonas sp. Leaf334]|uniref:hypothetical protein n=1 Tax=Cellulomonas sp. Leaf334 TaxID=1736339 RepID=UPI000A58C890|nr:hypothetical protein [Cellulomonas sp. Leaf334]
MNPELFLIEYHTRERELAVEAEHRLACTARPQSAHPVPHLWRLRRLLAAATH